ncbi:scavenger receptor class F member 1 [Callorhinchus milii]|uniref:scavenger receptor class F member 1 n=1 Tax=Callorhinchus milii TaxID=7868 RepID=UPI001C3FD94B|nr:scavenger receptor class F member 1 [Callorhinchus milii]
MESLLLLVSSALIHASHTQQLQPNGTNVCRSPSDPPTLICCPGWKPRGHDCTIAVCEEPNTCRLEEICIRPGVCRCPHGYYGAQCITRCPDQFWGPDCRELCPCYPNGKCHGVTGACTCRRGHWGVNCARTCRCQRGKCNPVTGQCECQAGWWGSDCSQACGCHNAGPQCDQASGRCTCLPGFLGKKCLYRCSCNHSPCHQVTAVCDCNAGWWGQGCDKRCMCEHGTCILANGICVCDLGFQGKECSEPCQAGYYGEGCQHRCGRCKDGPCSSTDGSCAACVPGWNGTRCNQSCAPGFHGENCRESCPLCRAGEVCDVETGVCGSCDPGWNGSRCDSHCPAGTFGDGCRFTCPDCSHGNCHHITGECLCDPGYTGDSCNHTCPEGYHGANCSTTCHCLGTSCDHVSGLCEFSRKGAVIAGVLVTLVVLLVCILCCCCCGADENDPKNRAVDEGRGPMARMKHHVQGVLANLSSTSFSFGNQKLPKITVSHHDADVTFNCSFIDSPSAGWDSASFSSFEADEEGPVYCVPPREGNGFIAVGEGFQEMSSRCNYLPAENSEFNSVEGLESFSIPRTSSIVKAKRPSVSFAEGTKFGPEERRGSMPESKVEPSNNSQRKRKLSWTLSKLPPIQSASAPSDLHLPVCEPYEYTELPISCQESETESRSSPPAGAGDHRRTLSNAKRGPQDVVECAEISSVSGDTEPGANEQKVTTVYVMVSRPQRASKIGGIQAEGSGKVQAMLKRFGSFQRQRSSPREGRRPIARGEGVSKARQKFIALDKNNRHQVSEPVGSSVVELKTAKGASLPRYSRTPTIGQPQATGSPSSTMTKKALIPTTSILRKLVANVEGTEERLEMIHGSIHRDTHSDQDSRDRERGHQQEKLAGQAGSEN